jgi:hypothetical protein
MSYLTNEPNYLQLIHQFLNFEIDAESFCQKFSSLWKIDRDEQESQRNSWSERYDLQLIDAFQRKEIMAEEFERKWVELHGYGEYKHLLEMVDKIFTACDAFNPKPESEYEIDEVELRNELRTQFANYETTQSNRF